MNAGAIEVARVFLGGANATKWDRALINKLGGRLSDFLDACSGALMLNEQLLGDSKDEREHVFHDEMRNGYNVLLVEMSTLMAAALGDGPELQVPASSGQFGSLRKRSGNAASAASDASEMLQPGSTPAKARDLTPSMAREGGGSSDSPALKRVGTNTSLPKKQAPH